VFTDADKQLDPWKKPRVTLGRNVLIGTPSRMLVAIVDANRQDFPKVSIRSGVIGQARYT
jgi:hypothetical protein